ncbi:hypothetical protein E2562_024319 [Oryza meyeriana var. granulata]|uniref:Uncharacterized protein n=1 Tax=Oryza meyeriana var. granulata TaxID=110450 RepID=A0A6G1C711_9ORYZ|nr:hypothetical protein E2562_024319 [Oryza meyeriana var. granulata]
MEGKVVVSQIEGNGSSTHKMATERADLSMCSNRDKQKVVQTLYCEERNTASEAFGGCSNGIAARKMTIEMGCLLCSSGEDRYVIGAVLLTWEYSQPGTELAMTKDAVT